MPKTLPVAALAASLSTTTLHAQLVEYAFNAEITRVTDAQGLLDPTGINTTSWVTGRLSYDPSLEVTLNNSTVGFVSDFGSLTFDVVSSTGKRTFGDPTGFMQLFENNTTFGDSFSFNGSQEIFPSDVLDLLDGGPEVSSLGQLQVFFSAPPTFDNTIAIPETLALDGLSASFVISANPREGAGFAINGRLTSLTLIPAPGSLAVFAVLGLAARRRRA